VSVRLQGSGDAFTADCLGNAVAEGQVLWQTLSLVDNELRCRTRNMTTNTDQTLAMTSQIEALSVTFGEDTDGDGFADVYRNNAAVTDWARVASVNVQLRVISSEDGVADAPQSYLCFDGAAVTPTDRRLRRTYSSVVALRNLLP
jgi:type IV pilus assembly protein PilW